MRDLAGQTKSVVGTLSRRLPGPASIAAAAAAGGDPAPLLELEAHLQHPDEPPSAAA